MSNILSKGFVKQNLNSQNTQLECIINQASKRYSFLKVSVILSESVDLAFVKAFGVEFDTLSQPASFMPKS